MPGALKDLLERLTHSREGVLPSIQAFPPLDIEQIASELRLDVRGTEDGGLNQPASDSELETIAEGDVLAEIERRARKGQDDYGSQLDLYDGRIRRALISADLRASVEAAGENALTDFKVQAIDYLNHLHSASREVEGRERELEEFRAAHRLVRLPNIVSPRDKSVRRLVLAVIVAGESILNGLFFAKGSETGLVGGIIQAIVLSFFNVGGAVLYARYGLPFLWDTRTRAKVFGCVVTALYAVWLFGLNICIGHFRDLFIQSAGQVGMTELASRIATNPLGFTDANSAILVLLGVALSIGSLIDAAGMDDLHFGYGAVARHHADAVSAYADRKTRYLAGLTETRDTAIQQMSGAIKELQALEYELRLAVEGRSRLHGHFRAYLNHLSESHIRLLQRYREANIRARSTPAPPRYQKRPERPGFLTEPPDLELPDFDKESRAAVIDRLGYFIKAVNQQFEAEARQFQTVAGLTDLGAKAHAAA